MARNEETSACWSQPRQSIPAKTRPGFSRGLKTDDIDSFKDIVKAFNYGERGRQRPESWQTTRNISNNDCFSNSGCCLKNGRVQYSCMCRKNNYPEQQNKSNQRYSQIITSNPLLFENKSPHWPDNVSNRCFQDNKMLEEFILDDNELSLLNYYEIPADVPKRRHVRNVGKVKTVSIIDTLSELASGATDREDEGGFSSAVSESAVLNRGFYKPRARHVRSFMPRKDQTFEDNSFPTSITSKVTEHMTVKKSSNNILKAPVDDFHCQNFNDDGHFTCSSLKRTLKYLRKAVSTNINEESVCNKKFVRETKDEDDAFRLCFSDSEVKDTPEQWASLRKEKLDFTSHAKSKSLLTVIDSFIDNTSKPSTLFRNRSKTNVPDWIQEVFCAAKSGDVEKMKLILKDIDPALVRNLSDDHGNNLWHICAVHNNFECLNWLCSHNQHHPEALKDENKNGFSPVSLAVKHGSLLAVQWLIHNTVSKVQLAPQNDSRSLLHVAARYGQDAIVEWLLNYMSLQDLDASIVDAEGNTALHLASKYGHIACVKALVFRIGCLKTKNEHGLKPLDLAVKHSKTDCADYLIALESCYNLAALNLRQHSEIQQLHKENAEIKSYFKELLALTKRLQNRQKELVQSYNRINPSTSQYDKLSEKNQYIDDYSKLLSSIITDEEHHLLLVEDRWKKSRKQVKYADSKKKPLDILRSQFSHVLEKVCCQSPPIPSTPETSDGSCQSEDDDPLPTDLLLPEFSAPDIVNSPSVQATVPFLNSKTKIKNFNSSHISRDLSIKPECIESSVTQNISSFPKIASNNRDVNLQMFFKQNPNLRQSGETCSVLEVLEPSSSDSEECSGRKKKPSKTYNSEKEAEQSSSSSAVETLSPYSCRPSSSGSKASGSRSSSNGSRQNPFLPISDSSSKSNSHSTSEKTKQTENESENNSPEVEDKGTNEQLNSNISSEPDLIKGTQKKKLFSDKERKSKDPHSDINENPNLSAEDSESLEADKSFSSAIDVPESQIQTNSDATNATTIKKKSFLLKFALRGRWPSKTTARSLKNEISPEEFRETYSRTSVTDPTPTSQIVASTDYSKENSLRKSLSYKVESEKIVSLDEDASTSFINEKLNDNGNGDVFNVPHVSDVINQTLMHNRRGLLPPRRDPPPAPPINVRDEESQGNSDDDMSISIQKSCVSSCTDDCLTSSVSLHNYISSRSSDLWHSSDSKSLFRPASSASRVGSLNRGDENYSLNKSSSASTEMLSALDSSTAGRQSPAPSEVSKTESALSPPSDVSKTESTRYLSQLGKIEESGNLTTINVSNLEHNDQQNISENILNKEIKQEIKHKKKSAKKTNSDKPWYEFSDEEDVIVPQRYQSVAVTIRSSSDDE